jgi:sugar-specific transcriptional regulator TrmB
MSDVLLKSLITSGLSELAAQLYIYLSKAKEKDKLIKNIAEKFQLSRVKIYDLLNELEDKNLLQKRQSYSRELVLNSPNQITSLLNQKEAEIKNLNHDLSRILPDLLYNFNSTQTKARVRYFDTKESFMLVLDEFVNESQGQIWTLGSPNVLDLVPGYMDIYIQNRQKKGVISNSIMFQSSTLAKRNHKQDLRPIKWFDSNVKGDAAYILYGSKIAIWNTLNPKIIVIEDRVIVEFFKTIWQVLWDKLD